MHRMPSGWTGVMIWFGCKKCGKRHGKAESLSGTLVFCDCGFGNRVPWSSTVPEPESPPAVPAPRPRAVPLDDRDDRRPPRRSVPVDDKDDWAPPSLRTRPRKEAKKINPNFCLVHDETPSQHVCKDCQLRFCSSCVVTLQGDTLCGPCKNFRLRGTHRSTPISPWAIISVLVGLVSAPIGFCMSLSGINNLASPGGGHAGLGVLLGLLAFLFPVAGLVLGLIALRQIEQKANVGGRLFAVTGAAAGLVGTVWSLTVVMLMILKAFD
jgi:hypothetical protein